MQGEHGGLEEDRSDPEGRGARGPARPDVYNRSHCSACASLQAPAAIWMQVSTSSFSATKSSAILLAVRGRRRPLDCRPRSFCALRFF